MQIRQERQDTRRDSFPQKKVEQKSKKGNSAIDEKTTEQNEIETENEQFQNESANYLQGGGATGASNPFTYQLPDKGKEKNPEKGETLEMFSGYYYDSTFSNVKLRKEVSAIQIYSLAGKLIGSYKPEKTDGYKIVLGKEVPQGVYLVNFEFKDKSTNIVKKIMKMNKEEQNYTITLSRIFPKVTTGTFRNSGSFSKDNTSAPAIPLGLLNTAKDGVHYVCEMKFNFDMEGYDFSDFDINVKRERTNTLDYHNGTEWKSDPKGTATGKDDTSPSGNICLVKDYKDPHIYDFDGPGLDAYSISIARFENILKAKEVVYVANFTQWVQFKEISSGIIVNDPIKLNWFCKIRFRKKALHSWELVSDDSSSGLGTTSLGH